jgi:hypothetical protein
MFFWDPTGVGGFLSLPVVHQFGPRAQNLDRLRFVRHFGAAGADALTSADKPASVEVALADPSWCATMEPELMSILDNETWTPLSLLHGHQAIVMKWFFEVK